jgi:hypothetical protein
MKPNFFHSLSQSVSCPKTKNERGKKKKISEAVRVRKIPQSQNPNPMDLRVTRRHKKREGKVERDIARVFYTGG